MAEQKIKNIGILEFHFHIKYLHTTMRICKTKNTNVTVFTTKEILTRIETYLDDKSKYEFVLKEDDESINSFLKRVKKICNEKIDLLFVNTIQTSCIDIPRYFRFKPKSKMILTVHMANHWMKARFSTNFKNPFRCIDANASMFFIRRIILPKFDAISVIYSPLKDFIKENTNYQKPVYILPFNFYDENKKISSKKKDDVIRFILPGLIEEYRRDYTGALDIFENLFKKYGKKIELCILGKPTGASGERIINRCEELKKKGYSIVFYKDFVPEEEYNKKLVESDVIFSPLHTVTKRETGIDEIYGTTEGSALPFEAIQYTKPLIVPKDFKVINELKSSTLTYASKKELEKLFVDIIENKEKLKNLKQNAVKNSKQYFSIDVLQKYFTTDILDRLNEL